MKRIEDYVISIPDFPEPGIIFRDITGILRDADGLKLSIDKIQEMLEGVEFDAVLGLESEALSLVCRLPTICIKHLSQ